MILKTNFRTNLIGGVLGALAMGVGHYFPWQKLLGRPLGRVERYCYGVGWIVTLGYMVSDLNETAEEQAHATTSIATGAGLAVVLSYAFDRALREYRRAQLGREVASIKALHRGENGSTPKRPDREYKTRARKGIL